jgi:hypothetical protein
VQALLLAVLALLVLPQVQVQRWEHHYLLQAKLPVR